MDKNLLTETILTINSISNCETYVVTWLSTAALLLIGVVITMVIYEAGLIIVHPVSAQTNNTTTTTGNGFSKFPPEDG